MGKGDRFKKIVFEVGPGDLFPTHGGKGGAMAFLTSLRHAMNKRHGHVLKKKRREKGTNQGGGGERERLMVPKCKEDG